MPGVYLLQQATALSKQYLSKLDKREEWKQWKCVKGKSNKGGPALYCRRAFISQHWLCANILAGTECSPHSLLCFLLPLSPYEGLRLETDGVQFCLFQQMTNIKRKREKDKGKLAESWLNVTSVSVSLMSWIHTTPLIFQQLCLWRLQSVRSRKILQVICLWPL